MDQHPAARRRREVIVTLALALLFGGGIFFFALLILGQLLIALLATVAVFALAAGLHYFTWGRTYARQTAAAPREEPPAPGPRRPRRF